MRRIFTVVLSAFLTTASQTKGRSLVLAVNQPSLNRGSNKKNNLARNLVLLIVFCLVSLACYAQPAFSTLVINSTNTQATLTFTASSGQVAGNNAGNQNLAPGDFTVSISASTGGGTVAAGAVTVTVSHTAPALTATLSFTIPNASTADGSEVLTVAPSANNKIYDVGTNNAMSSATTITGNLKDLLAPTISSVSPASGASVNSTAVGYTLSEALASGTVTWLGTAGPDNGNSHAQVLSAGERSTGAHSGVLSSPPTLVSGSTYQITFAGSDANSNAAAPVIKTGVIFDNSAPAAPSTPAFATGDDTGSSGSDGITKNTTNLTFTGTAEANSSVQLYDGSTPVGSPVTATGGNYSIDLSLAQGTYSINAKATDAANNTSAASGNTPITVDTTPPSQPGVPDMTAGTDVGSSPTDNITSDNTPDFTGSGTNGSTITVTSSVTGTVGTGTVSGGVYTITVSTLSDGAHDITVVETDLAGNSSVASNALGVTIDTAPPSAPSTPDLQAASDSGSSPTDDNTNDNTPTFDVTGTAGLKLEILDGATVVATLASATAGPDALTASTLSDGVKSITARVTDVAGNTASSAALSVTIDTTPPSAPTTPDLTTDTGSSATDNITNDNTPDFSVTGTSGFKLEILQGGSTVIASTASATGAAQTLTSSSLSDASYSITARTTDVAGNTATSSALNPVVIDTSAPSAPGTPDLTAGTDTGTSNTDNITNDVTPDFTVGSVTSGNTVNIISSVNGASGSGLAAGTSITVTATTLTQGNGQTHTITATQTDPAGNTSSASSGLSITVDATAPTITSATFNASFNNATDADYTTCSATAISNTTSREYVHLTMSEALGLSNGTIPTLQTASTGTIGFNVAGYSGSWASSNYQTFSGCSNRGGCAYHVHTGNTSPFVIHLQDVFITGSTDGLWTTSTTFSFVSGGTNIKDVAGNEMASVATIVPGATAPLLASSMVLNPNGSGNEIITFTVDQALNTSTAANAVTGITVDADGPGPGAAVSVSGTYSTTGNTVTLTSSANNQWSSVTTVSYSAAGNLAGATGVAMAAFTSEKILLGPVTIVSNNSNTAWAKQGDVITISFTANSTLSGAPTATIGGLTATIGGSQPNYTASVTTDATVPQGVVAFTITATESGRSTDVPYTTNGSTVTYDKTAPTISPITIASNNATNTAYAKVGDVVTISYTATDNLGTISVTPATIDGFAATTVSATAATLTTTSSDVEGVMPFSITFTDQAGNSSVKTATTNASSVTFDKTPPTVSSVAIDPTLINAWSTSVNGITPSLHSNTLNYFVNFSEPVNGLSFSDLNGVKAPNPSSVINLSPGTVTSVGGPPAAQWKATALYTSGSGTFEVDFDPASNSVTAPFATGTGQITVNNGSGQVNSFSGTNFTGGEIQPNYDIYTNTNQYIGTVNGGITITKFSLQNGAVVAGGGTYTGSFKIGAGATNQGTGSGTISANTGSSIITGTGTSFTNSLAVNDLIFNGSGNQYIGTVQSITSNTSVQLTLNANTNHSGSYSVRRPGTMTYTSQVVDNAGNVVSTAFKAGSYYNISLDQPSSNVASLSATAAASSITVNWTDVSGATNYLVMLKNASGTFPVASAFGGGGTLTDGVFFNDDTDLADGVMKLNIAQGTQSAQFTGLSSGTSYDFIIYPYALSTDCIVAGDKSAIDYNITTPATATKATITASLSSIVFNSAAVSISSISDTQGTSTNVMSFKIFDDGQDPVSPNVMTLHLNDISQESITFTLREQLTLSEGASVTGFSSSTGTVASAIYSGKGTTNTITLINASDGTWNSGTTISYSAATGNAILSTSGAMQSIVSHAVVQVSDAAPQTFTTSGSFQIPAGVTTIQVEAWGGGGSGGGWDPAYGGGSQGGGGGAYSRSLISVTPLNTYNYVVGAGGAPIGEGSWTTFIGQAGGQTSFGGGLVTAAGGQGGENSAYFADYGTTYNGNLSPGRFGIGGQASNSIGTVKFNGGNGGLGGSYYTGTGRTGVEIYTPGGSGGTSAGSTANGVNGISGPTTGGSTTYNSFTQTFTPPGPLDSGDGGYSYWNWYGGAGAIPGGGGGGFVDSYGYGYLTSGAGASGMIRITYSNPSGGGTSDWAADNSPFKFSQLVITQGTGNGITDWRTIIAGAELYDGTNTVSGTVNPTDGSDITFTTIVNPSPTHATDVGFIDDANGLASAKTYTLKVWLKNNLGSPLNANVDGLKLAFQVDPTKLTYDDATNSNQKSSRLVSTQPTVQSGGEPITVTATALAFTTQPAPTSQLVLTSFSTPPVVTAVDKNGNTDHDFTGKTVNITNSGTIAENPGNTTSLSIISSLGIINLPANFQYTDQGDGTLIANSPASAPYPALSSASAPSTGAVACSPVTVTYTNASTLTAGTGTPTISSIASSNVPVFSFTIKDDGGSGGDGAATKIKALKFTPNASDFFGLASAHNNFQDLIASATLTDNSGIPANTITITSANGINPNDITFSSIPFAAGNLGNVADNATKIYTLSIVPNTTLTGGLPSIADNKQLILDLVPNPNITLDATGSTIPGAATSVNSGTGNGTFQVIATKTSFITQPPATGGLYYLVNVSLSSASQVGNPSVPSAEAVDARGNRDLDYSAGSGAVTISSSLGLSSTPTSFTSGLLSTTAFNGMSFTTIGINQTFTITPTSANASGTPGAKASNGFDVKVGTATTISNPTELNTGAVSSIANTQPQAVQVFSFKVNEDGAGSPDDGNPTLITGVTIKPSSINDATYLTDWTQVIAGAALSDGVKTVTGTILSNSISFTSMPASISGDIGYITDGGANGTPGSSKTYTLSIWLKPTLSTTPVDLPANIDGKKFGFEVANPANNVDIVTSLTGTQIGSGSGIPGSPAGNAVAVVATQLDFTSPPLIGASASLNSPFTNVYVRADDVNKNLDLDYHNSNTVTTFTNNGSPTVTMANGPVASTTAFNLGVIDFSTSFPNFQFTSGNNGQAFTLTMTSTGGLTGTSSTITLKVSQESSLQLDPTFPVPARIPYVGYQSTNLAASATGAYELVRALLVDGNRTNYTYGSGTLNTDTEAGDAVANGDSDNATTNLTSITLRIYKPSDLRRIALYSNGTYIPGTDIDVATYNNGSGLITSSTVSYDFTWSQAATTATNLVLLTAPEDGQAPLSVYVSFRNTSPELKDLDDIQIQLQGATAGTGSQFFTGPPNINNPGPYVGGGTQGSSPQSLGLIDVVATSLDFTTQPSAGAYAGIKEKIGIDPATTQPYSYGNPASFTQMPTTTSSIVTARDKYTLVDTEFNSSPMTATPIVITDPAGDNITSPASFVNGVLDLNGMEYNTTGDGTLKVTAGGLDSSNPPVANTSAIPGTLVNVVNVTATYNGNGVLGNGTPAPASSPVSIKGGSQAQVIFGVTFKAYGATGSEPNLKKFSISFDKPFHQVNGSTITDIFTNFVVKEGSTDVTAPSIQGVLTKSLSAANAGSYGAGSLDMINVDLSAIPRQLYAATGQSLTYYLIADVDPTANIGTPSLTPQIIDGGYGTTTDANIIVSKGTASGVFDGNVYSFASTKPPLLLTSKTSKTKPYTGQLNVDAGLTHIDLEFDVQTASLDGGLNNGAELFDRTSGIKIADLVAPYNAGNIPIVPGNYISTGDVKNVIPVLSYNIQFLPGKSFKPDSIYYVTMVKGEFDNLTQTGKGVSDQGLNFFGGISSSTTLYFKISSVQPLKLNGIKSPFDNAKIGSLSTQFDQFGTAYYLIIPTGSTPPTVAQVKTPITNPYLAATVAAKGSYVIDRVNTLQTVTFQASFTPGQIYDVYLYAENDANPTPVSAGGIYGTNLLANGGGPTLKITVPLPAPSNNQPDFLICANSFTTVADPIILGESAATDFQSGSVQNFNILLPPGYEFDVSTKPSVQFVGSDFVALTAPLDTIKFISNSLVRIQYKNTGSGSVDFIIISNMRVIGTSGSATDYVQRFYGSNTFATPTANVATIGLVPTQTFTFDNSFSQTSTTYSPFPSPSPTIVNAIPDNYFDPLLQDQKVRLIPLITVPNDYNASLFDGTGVTNDILSLTSVPTDAAFNITMSHTDPNGCVSQKSQQYLVYDHTSPISDKLGSFTTNSSIAQGTAKDLVNPNFPGAAPTGLSAQTILHNELAGYELISLSADLPTSELRLNAAKTRSQIISGPDWRTAVKNIIPISPSNPTPTTVGALGTYYSYKWDYSHILNAKTEVGGSITTDPYYGKPNVPDSSFVKQTTNGNTYWTGGSLGQVEFTGVYRSTADLSVVVPFRQDVELFVPAVPLIEVSNQSSFDASDGTTNTGNSQTAYNYIKNKFGYQYTNANGYQGTSIFCEAGGTITLNGYPAALAGSSTGAFGIFNYESYDFTKTPANNSAAAVPPNGGFVDTQNGTATIDPLKVKNNYDDILVTYTYQGNNSPAVGIGYLIIRVTPNPVPKFAISSLAGLTSPSSTFDSFCKGNSVNFDASGTLTAPISTIASSSQGTSNTIDNYIWDFGDPNSGRFNSPSTVNLSTNSLSPGGTGGTAIQAAFVQPNAPASQTYDKPSHIFTVSSTYTVALTLTSNWGCSSSVVTVANNNIQPRTSDVLYPGSKGDIVVGDIPVVDFSFVGNCVNSPMQFTDLTPTPLGNSATYQFNWRFDAVNNPGVVFTGYNLNQNKKLPPLGAVDGQSVSNTYSAPGIYTVSLTAITSLGCKDSKLKYVSQLAPTNPFTEYFDDATKPGSGWQVLNLKKTVPTPVTQSITSKEVSWLWGSTSNRNHPIFNSTGSNTLWSTSNASYQAPGAPSFYDTLENSALYSPCFNLDPTVVPRPMIAFSAFVDVAQGDGLVLQYSTDNFNILDPAKVWNNLGDIGTGIDWYTTKGLAALPGSAKANNTGLGWSGNGIGDGLGTDHKWIHPKHALDILSAASQRVIFRFAFASGQKTTTAGLDGVAIDSIFFGSRTRTILFENFTSTDGGANTQLSSNIKSDNDYIRTFVQNNINSTQLVDINYHVGFVGNDPFAIDNSSDPGARALYYGVKNIPFAFLDGIHYKGPAPANSDLFKTWGQAEYDLNTLQLAKADFDDKAAVRTLVTSTAGGLKIDVKFTPLFDLPTGVGQTTLHVAVLEKSIAGAPSYGSVTTNENSFEYVLKQMLPSAVGTQFTSPIKGPTPGATPTSPPIYYPVNVGTFYYTPKNMHSTTLTVVVFLQNETTKEVYQAHLIDNLVVNVVTAVEPTAENIKLYPNPADHELTVELPSAVKEKTSLRLANQWGQFTEMADFDEGEQKKTISTRDLAEGVYILQLGSGNSAVRSKVVVIHK